MSWKPISFKNKVVHALQSVNVQGWHLHAMYNSTKDHSKCQIGKPINHYHNITFMFESVFMKTDWLAQYSLNLS